jgi:phosphopantothenoylcysteine synthetase/decarboxylase
VHGGDSTQRDPESVLYLVVSGAPAPEGVPALVERCQAAGWRVVVFSTPIGTRFIDPAEVEGLTGEPVRSEYRMPGTSASAPPADAVLACPLTFNSVNKFAHGHADKPGQLMASRAWRRSSGSGSAAVMVRGPAWISMVR